MAGTDGAKSAFEKVSALNKAEQVYETALEKMNALIDKAKEDERPKKAKPKSQPDNGYWWNKE